MKTFPSLKDAQAAQDEGAVFVEIHRITDDEWHAYETVEEAQAAEAERAVEAAASVPDAKTV